MGEAIRLTRADIDLDAALITVLHSKFGKSRLVPLHPDTTGMLRRYAARRDQLRPAPATSAFFISAKGTPLLTGNIDAAFARLPAIAGITAPPGHARPRVHDLRHTMAVRALLLFLSALGVSAGVGVSSVRARAGCRNVAAPMGSVSHRRIGVVSECAGSHILRGVRRVA